MRMARKARNSLSTIFLSDYRKRRDMSIPPGEMADKLKKLSNTNKVRAVKVLRSGVLYVPVL